MPYKSSEIRWFSEEKELLWSFYENLFPKGKGFREENRTDFYLWTQLQNTGVKVREGQHEIKVKSATDEQTKYGTIEHWIKWSMPAEENILNTVSYHLFTDWIAVEKQRWIKKYEVLEPLDLDLVQDQIVEEGCGVEFTTVFIPLFEKTLFTVGFEGFSSKGHCRKNLMAALELLKVNVSELKGLAPFSYPEMLSRLVVKK